MTDNAESLQPILRAIMEQAQVFASTSSLVGGRFDDGSKFQQSEAEKAELEWMITQALNLVFVEAPKVPVTAERERCAKIAEDDVPPDCAYGPGKGIAAKIRGEA